MSHQKIFAFIIIFYTTKKNDRICAKIKCFKNELNSCTHSKDCVLN